MSEAPEGALRSFKELEKIVVAAKHTTQTIYLVWPCNEDAPWETNSPLGYRSSPSSTVNWTRAFPQKGKLHNYFFTNYWFAHAYLLRKAKS